MLLKKIFLEKNKVLRFLIIDIINNGKALIQNSNNYLVVHLRLILYIWITSSFLAVLSILLSFDDVKKNFTKPLTCFSCC